MSNRLYITNSLFRISRPGRNVLSPGANDLMFDGTSPVLQVIQRGLVYATTQQSSPSGPDSLGNYSAVVNMPNQGFTPIIFSNAGFIQYISNSQFRIGMFQSDFFVPTQWPMVYIVTGEEFVF